MVWQYAQSPRRAQFSASCPKNAACTDGNCYASGLPQSPASFIDLDVAQIRQTRPKDPDLFTLRGARVFLFPPAGVPFK